MLAAFLVAVLCTPLPTCGEGPRLVQAASRDAGSASTASIQFNADNTSGDWIGVAIRAGNHAGHVLSVTDSSGNSYVKAGQLEETVDTVSLAIFYAESVASGPNIVTVTDASSPGTLRAVICEYAGVGGLAAFTTAEGAATAVPLAAPNPIGSFTLTAVSAADPTSISLVPNTTVSTYVAGKLFVQDGATEGTLVPARPWGLIRAEFGEVCASPTPVVMHDQIADATLAGYSLFYREPGGIFQKLVDWPCDWSDSDEDGIIDTRTCRAADLGAPIQRYCPLCAPFNEYEFAVKAYDIAGIYSANYSNVVSICMPPICDVVGHGPCN